MRTQPNSHATPPRLTTLVTLGVSATVLLTVLALLILVDHFALNYAEREAGQRLQQLSWQMRDALNRGVQKAGGDVRLLSELPQLRAARSPDEVRTVLDSLQRASPDYAWIGLAARDGRVLAATQNLLEGVDVSNRTWFQAGRDGLYAGDAGPLSAAAEIDDKLPASGAPWRFIDVAGPVPGADGSVRGVLGVRMSWGWARRLMHGVLAPAEQTDAAEIFVVRGDGQVLLGPAGMEQQRLQTASLALSHSGKSGAVRETWSDEREYLSGYSLTGQTGDAATLPWSVIVRQPLAVALADARALERQILLLGAFLGVVLAAAAAVIARRYTRPFNQLSAQLERHSDAPDDAAGLPDSATIATIATVGSFHELQVLSGALARMVHKEQQHLAALRTLNEQLETTVAERTREIASKALQLERALAQEHTTQLLLQERAAELRAILDNTHDAFIALDHRGVILDWNRQAEKLIGWRRAEVIGQPLGAMVLPPLLRRTCERDMQLLAERGPGAGASLSRRMELTMHHRDGQELPVEASVAYVPRSGGHVFIAFLHDISERKRMIASLEEMALHDTLTGLPNRRALMQTLPAALQRAQRSGQRCAVFFLDLDRFKQVNDRYGHEEGDELLRQFADRVRGAVRKTDTVGRLAGDEFIVIVEMLGSDADAYEAADKLGPLLRQPFMLKTVTVALSASVGVAIHHPDDPQDVATLLARADRAMYAVKQRDQRQALP
ncbi:UNVERIFIED_ORG: PAS domain S-box-containing protein/diguanylate cyclase (GGDEF)-like protein [Zoogloea ramigera]|uniref:Diguanylate cyclase n=1 Tax=Duganella zoogloeoides TaxID=75659 RepID=A0ABZ0XVC0_9BURK|nr:diguanylate cyclase [Duganella zoogloeoides]WQH03095.1 diguanylate cyclase [Duganella zoogloeoides]